MIWQPVLMVIWLFGGICGYFPSSIVIVMWAICWPLWFVRILVTLRDRAGLCFDKCIIVLSFDS